jgi:probable rRNA maturation factor
MIVDRQRTVRVALPPLELFWRRVRDALGVRKAEVTVCLVSDAEIARMNEVFRKKKGPTDVLSFPSGTTKKRVHLRTRPGVQKAPRRAGGQRSAAGAYLGDIAISPDAARRNAKEGGHPLQTEMRILILHGLLHLLGYDHETDQGEMDGLEQRLRRRFKLA